MLVGEGCKRVEEGIESPSSPGAKEAKEAHAGGTAFGAARACGGHLAHPFANQMDLLLIASWFSELRHAQIKAFCCR